MVYEQYWKAKRRSLLSREERLQKTALALGLSHKAKQRLEWFLWHEGKGGKKASLTCRHFGITRSLFYKWHARFDETDLRTLEDLSRVPGKKRERVSSTVKDGRVIALRKQYPAYGKEKLRVLCAQAYGELITA